MIKGSAKPGIYKIVQLAAEPAVPVERAEDHRRDRDHRSRRSAMALPTALPIPTREYPLIKPGRDPAHAGDLSSPISFPARKIPIVGIDFLLNGQQYDVTQVNYVADVGSAEEWHLVVGDSQHGGTEGHPFHIHVNSFEVISINGKAAGSPAPSRTPSGYPPKSTVVIRTRFKQFVGKIGLPLPHPAARGHRHDAELPDQEAWRARSRRPFSIRRCISGGGHCSRWRGTTPARCSWLSLEPGIAFSFHNRPLDFDFT